MDVMTMTYPIVHRTCQPDQIGWRLAVVIVVGDVVWPERCCYRQ